MASLDFANGFTQFTESYQRVKTGAITETISLTGIQTKSDAWGKVVPLTFGRVRVPGALVWASEFYKTTQSYDVTVEYRNKYNNYSQVVDQYGFYAGANNQYSESSGGTQITHNSVTNTNIDLCYSFGKDGDPRKKRYVDIIRINEQIVFNSKTGYIAPGIAFNVRYGYENRIDPIMAKYDNGDLFYKEQTLIIFSAFPTANYGNAIPSNIDVEFGCVKEEQEIYPCEATCGVKVDLDKPLSRTDAQHDRILPGEVRFTPCSVIMLTVAKRSDFEGLDAPYNQVLIEGVNGGTVNFTVGNVAVVLKQLTEAEAIQYNKSGVQLITPYDRQGKNLIAGRVRVLQVSQGWTFDGASFQDPAESHYSPKTFAGPAIVFRDAFVYADMDGSQPGVVTSQDPVVSFTDPGIQQTSHTVQIASGSTAEDGAAIDCPGRYYFAVLSTRINFTPC